jgi:hypothetical protein
MMQSKRAVRYEVAAPVRYRISGAKHWLAGLTVNLSRSGVLLQGEAAVAPGMGIDLWITLPSAVAGHPGPEVVGSAIVVRSNGRAGTPEVAAKFDRHALRRAANAVQPN